MDRTVNATAAYQRILRGVDEGVDFQLRDVAECGSEHASDGNSLRLKPHTSGPCNEATKRSADSIAAVGLAERRQRFRMSLIDGLC